MIEEGGFGTYAGTKNRGAQIGNGVQRHHLNQTGVFNFDRDLGEVIGLRGQAAVQGTQHYNAHLHMDDFYERFVQAGRIPSVFRYNIELYRSLRNADMGRITSLRGVYNALLEQMRNGKYLWNKVDNIRVRRVAHH